MSDVANPPMMDEVSICNLALGWLGVNPITGLTDRSTQASLCRANYPILRDAVLEERMWTFATQRKEYTTEDMAPGGFYTHRILHEWLGVYRVFKSNVNYEQRIEWRREGDQIISRYPNIIVWGLRRVTNTGEFSTLFTQALAARIAADLAMALTENAQLQADMWSLYREKLDAAAARDGMQGTNDKIEQSQLVNVRYGGESQLWQIR